MGKAYDYIMGKFNDGEKMLFSLIDPLDYPSVDKAVETAKNADEAGADIILVGGSLGVQGELLDSVAKRIKESIHVPLVLFPGNIATVTRYADAIYFMSLLNSRNPYWITRAQMMAAPVIKKMGIETLSTAYIVVEPGGTVGWVGDVDIIPRAKPKIAAAFAMVAETFGFKFILTDTGSNPKEGHIPLEFISAVKKNISIPYIVAGGIRTPEQAKAVVKAGADIIQVGTAFEGDGKREKIKQFVDAIKKR
jgi:phosphoglycerol geranylgeranyltransferase